MNTCNYSHLIFDKEGRFFKNPLEKRKCLQQFLLGKLEVHKQKNEIRTISIQI